MWPELLKHCMFCVEQKLSGSHKALVEMQDDVSELMRSASKEHPTSKVTPQVCSPCPLGLPSALYRAQDQLLLSIPLH